MRVTLVHPRMGHRGPYRSMRTWEMQPLWAAVLAGATPDGVEVTLADDRLQDIDLDAPTDLVGINVETFTARRAYEIAAGFRSRGVPVVLGGFHVTLLPDEAAAFADSIVVGEGEGMWPRVLADAAAGRLAPRYRAEEPSELVGMRTDRSVFAGKRYLPLELVETGRGCPHDCEFCSVTTFYGGRYRRRPASEVIDEVRSLQRRRVFFVDDNVIGSGGEPAMELFRALEPLGVQWLSQASIDTSRDEALLSAIQRSGCRLLLVGLESLDPANLALMGKRVNAAATDYDRALSAFRRHRIPLYVTMLLGYDHDDETTPGRLYEFAARHRLFMAAFNHVTPFPGTRLYDRLLAEGRLRFETWWLDDGYSYGSIPYEPAGMSAALLEEACQRTRRRFYGAASIARRALDPVNTASPTRAGAFFAANLSLMRDVPRRQGLLLGERGA